MKTNKHVCTNSLMRYLLLLFIVILTFAAPAEVESSTGSVRFDPFSPNFYLRLGLPADGRNVTKENIQKAYRRAANHYHPDKSGGMNNEAMTRINEAKKKLLEKKAFIQDIVLPRHQNSQFTTKWLSNSIYGTFRQLSAAAQTTLFIAVIVGINEVIEEMYMREVRGEEMSAAEIFEHAGIAMTMITTSPQLYASYTGAMVSNIAFAKQLDDLRKEIITKFGHTNLGALLQSAVYTTVTFGGWELGGQLWREAIYNMETHDITRAEKLSITDMIKSFAQRNNTDDPETQENIRIFEEILKNLGNTLVDGDARAQWIYNTWRHSFLSGEFITMYTALLASGAVGIRASSWVPWPIARPPVALGISVFSAIAALHFIPDSVTQGITNFNQNQRVASARLRLARNAQDLQSLERQWNDWQKEREMFPEITNWPKPPHILGIERQFSSLLNQRKSYREDMYNVFFEKMLYLRQIEIRYSLILKYSQIPSTVTGRKGHKLREKQEAHYQEAKKRLDQLYESARGILSAFQQELNTESEFLSKLNGYFLKNLGLINEIDLIDKASGFRNVYLQLKLMVPLLLDRIVVDNNFNNSLDSLHKDQLEGLRNTVYGALIHFHRTRYREEFTIFSIEGNGL